MALPTNRTTEPVRIVCPSAVTITRVGRNDKPLAESYRITSKLYPSIWDRPDALGMTFAPVGGSLPESSQTFYRSWRSPGRSRGEPHVCRGRYAPVGDSHPFFSCQPGAEAPASPICPATDTTMAKHSERNNTLDTIFAELGLDLTWCSMTLHKLDEHFAWI